MTTTNLIETRKKRLEQRKNKLKQIEASLNAQERKRRTRRLIEVGGLVAKADIIDWNSNTLFGALLYLKEKESDKKQMESWTHKGGAAFSEEKVQRSPVIVKFETKPIDEIRTSLKSLGLKWNSLRQEWEGYAKVNELKELLKPHKASVQVLDATA